MSHYSIYYTYDNQGWWLLECSDQPLFDYAMLSKYRQLTGYWVISQPLPLGLAHYLVGRTKLELQKAGGTPAQGDNWVSNPFRDFGQWVRNLVADHIGTEGYKAPADSGLQLASQRIGALLHQVGYPTVQPYSFDNHSQVQDQFMEYQRVLDSWAENVAVAQLMNCLGGRLLLEEEVEKVLRFHGIAIPGDTGLFLRWLSLQGLAQIWPGVGYNQEHILTCFRCGQSTGLTEVKCNQCAGTCYQCEECLNMGKASYCNAVYAFIDPGPSKGNKGQVAIRQDWPLTPAQQRASDHLCRFVAADSGDEGLIWAVCGAGKTEVCFRAMAQVLERGGQVLFAIPRRDVVVELEERLRYAFPELKICALYGGSTQTWQQADLTLATTHQVLRFYQKFDLVVLDEVDAFPYKDSAMLKNAVHRAVKPGGKKVYLTATPEPEILQSARRGATELIRIPARHHGYPLPEPELITAKGVSLAKPEQFLTDEVLRWLLESVEGNGSQVFVFVPTIKLAELVADQLSKALAQGLSWVEVSHSKDPQRETKRQKFAAGEFPIFVTTTIMERGITVPKTDVLVLFANHSTVFNTGTLVQMAGRAGRSTRWPMGRVRFMADTVSSAMREAVQQIAELNQYGRKLGFITGDVRETND